MASLGSQVTVSGSASISMPGSADSVSMGALTMNGGIFTLAGSGQIQTNLTMNGGKLVVLGTLNVLGTGNTMKSPGYLDGTGIINFSNDFVVSGGTIATAQVNAGPLLRFIGPTSISTGTINIPANGVCEVLTTITGSNSANLKNSGTMLLGANASLAVSTGGWTVTNYGTITASSASTPIAPYLNNNGLVQAPSGKIILQGGGTGVGLITTYSDMQIDGGVWNFPSSATLNVGGNMIFSNGTNTIACTYNVTGSTIVTGGTTLIAPTATVVTLGQSLIMNGTGSLTINVLSNPSGLPRTIMKNGTLIINVLLEFPYDLNVEGGTIILNAAVTIMGNLKINGTLVVNLRLTLPSDLYMYPKSVLNGTGLATVNGNFYWYGGTLSQLTVVSNLWTTVEPLSSSVFIANSATLMNYGVTNVTGNITGSQNSNWQNTAGGIINLLANANLLGNAWTTTNYGTVIKSSASATQISCTWR